MNISLNIITFASASSGASSEAVACDVGRAWDFLKAGTPVGDECICITFKCCCRVPVGYYSLGDRALRCPGGTYQDQVGEGKCKKCAGPEGVKYRVVGKYIVEGRKG